MPNSLSCFNFVSRDGDSMEGDLSLGLNLLKLNNGTYGGCIRGHNSQANRVHVRNIADDGDGYAIIGGLTSTQNIAVNPTKTVDGVDVSEIGVPSGKLYLGTDQENLTNGVSTTVALDTIGTGYTDEIEDIGNYKITPGVAGLYLCIGQVRFKSVVATKHYLAAILLSGVTYLDRNQGHSSVAEDLSLPVLALYWFSNSDYVQLRATQWSGGDTVDIGAREDDTFLSVQCLRR